MDCKNVSKYHRLQIFDGLELLDARSHTLDFPFHTHNTFNIALILDTTFNTRLNDKFLKAPKGTLSITNPDEVHATPCDQELGNSFFTYYVSPEAIKDFNSGQPVFFEDRIVYDQQIFNELYFLSQNYANQSEFEKRLTFALKRLIKNYSTIKAVDFKTNRLFQAFINEANFDSFSLDKTASQFGINKYKFIRLFKQETGLTPNNFVNLKRIEQSKNLLKNGTPIFATAIDCGFYDVSHFYKNFKRFTGVTPLDFQEALFIK